MVLLLSFWIFDHSRPDVVILEVCLLLADSMVVSAPLAQVGIGGRYDATNIVPAEAVCGVSLLDLDHTRVLGNTLESIAFEKGGIFKPGVQHTFSVPQQAAPLAVLQQCALEAGCALSVVPPLGLCELGLAGDHQVNHHSSLIQLGC